MKATKDPKKEQSQLCSELQKFVLLSLDIASMLLRYSLDKPPIERNVFTRVMSNRILRIEGKKIPAIMNLGVRG
jgi:hypothetical protein